MPVKIVRVCASLFVLVVLVNHNSFAQVTGDYRANLGTFDFPIWSDRTNWERFNGATWVTPSAAQGYPGFSSTPTTTTVDFGFFSSMTLNVNMPNPLNNLVLTGSYGLLTTSGNPNLTLNANLSIPDVPPAMTFNSTGNLTVNGTSNIVGTFTDNNNAGTTTMVGTVTLSGSWTSTAVTTPARLIFRGGITNNGGDFGGGAGTFNTNNQSLAGNGDIIFSNAVTIDAVTLTNTSTGNFYVAGVTTLQTSGGFTDNSNNGTESFIGNVVINASTSFTTTSSTTAGNLVFGGGITNNGTFAAGGATFNTANQTVSGGNAMPFANNVAITGVTVDVTNTSSWTVNGTTTLSTSGGFTDSNNNNVTTFVGTVTIGANTTFTSTAVSTTSNMLFRGGIANNGTLNGGGATFLINNQALSGAGDSSFANNILINSVTLTNSNSGDLLVTGTTTLQSSGGFTDNSNNGTDTFVGQVLVNSGTTFLSTASTTVGNLIFRGGINNDGTFNGGGATFNTNNQSLTGNNAFSFGTVAITGIVLNASTGANVTINGTTTLTGAGGGFTDSNDNNTTLLVGNVSVGAGTTFNTTALTNTSSHLTFRGGIANNGTFNGGAALFDTNNQSLTGANTINFSSYVAVTGIAVTNSNTSAVTLTGTNAPVLGGTGSWTQDVNSTLNFNGGSITLASMTASATNNTVNYNRNSAQTIFNPVASTYYNLTLSNSGINNLVSNTIALGDILISNTAIFSLVNGGNNYSLAVGGDWTNSSTDGDPLTEGTNTITFNGTTAQLISNTGNANGPSFGSLTFNNSFATAPQITISNTSAAKTSLTMLDGVVDLSLTTFTLGTGVGAPGTLTHAGAAANGWFYNGTFFRNIPTGNIATGGLVGYYPVGSLADYRPFSFSGNVTTGGTISVRHVDGTGSPDVNFPDGASTVVKRHDANWVVNRANVVTGGTFAIRAEGTGFGTVGNVSDLRITHVNDATTMGTAGTNAGSNANPQVNRTGLSGPQLSSTFYIGSVDGTNTPLPVELISFVAKVNGDEVLFTWKTAAELNNKLFTVERALNVEKFDPIGTIDGNGTTTQPHDYTLSDLTPIYGRSYYRLMQTDFDGQHTYSRVVSIDFQGPQFPSVHVYPNPSEGRNLKLLITGLKDQKQVPVKIISTTGQVVYENTFDVETPGTLQTELLFGNSLDHGVYIIKAGRTIALTQKLIIE